MGIKTIDEEEDVYICDKCGEEFTQDNYGMYGCIYLVDDRIHGEPKVIGVWCNEECMSRWLDKYPNILSPQL